MLLLEWYAQYWKYMYEPLYFKYRQVANELRRLTSRYDISMAFDIHDFNTYDDVCIPNIIYFWCQVYINRRPNVYLCVIISYALQIKWI